MRMHFFLEKRSKGGTGKQFNGSYLWQCLLARYNLTPQNTLFQVTVKFLMVANGEPLYFVCHTTRVCISSGFYNFYSDIVAFYFRGKTRNLVKYLRGKPVLTERFCRINMHLLPSSLTTMYCVIIKLWASLIVFQWSSVRLENSDPGFNTTKPLGGRSQCDQM